jgi:hypothetical protein
VHLSLQSKVLRDFATSIVSAVFGFAGEAGREVPAIVSPTMLPRFDGGAFARRKLHDALQSPTLTNLEFKILSSLGHIFAANAYDVTRLRHSFLALREFALLASRSPSLTHCDARRSQR